jgi:PKD repeat protein
MGTSNGGAAPHMHTTTGRRSGRLLRRRPPLPTPFPVRRAAGPATRTRSRGQAVVEFALLVPVLLAFLALGIDAGRIFFSWIEVVNAAREGAAYAAGNPTDSTGITARVTREANVQGQAGEGTFSVATACKTPGGTSLACSSAMGGDGSGNTVTVTVSRTFGFITPVVGNVLGSGFAVRGSATAAVFGLVPYGGEDQPDECRDPRNARFNVSQSDMTVYLDASDSTPNSGRCAIASYDWDMGDGLDPWPPVVGKQTHYTYATAGTYTITLRVSNPGGSEITTVSVTVPPVAASPTAAPTATPAPTPVPTSPPDPACTMVALISYSVQGESNKINFYGAYTGQPAPASWFWAFGDGSVDFGQAPARHTYSGSGPYTVTLTTMNGSCSSTATTTVYP